MILGDFTREIFLLKVLYDYYRVISTIFIYNMLTIHFIPIQS